MIWAVVTDLRIMGYNVLLSAIIIVIYCQNIAEIHYYSDLPNQIERPMNRKTFVFINIFIYHQNCCSVMSRLFAKFNKVSPSYHE